METRQLRKRVRGTPEERPPEWLPDGWTVEVRNTRHGNYRYYRSPVSGSTFQSKEEVLRHLSLVKHDSGTSGRASCSNESKQQPAKEMKEPPECSPSGWILGIKSRRRGKTAGKTYESPDSNREFSETATVTGRLLQPCSSQENVKPEEQNPKERTPKNGMITSCKFTRKSNISNEKADLQNEANIKLEKVTEKRSDPSDQISMDTQSETRILAKHAEDKANKGEEIKPQSPTKSMENSNEEDEAILEAENVPEKLPLVSDKTSKKLLGDEMKLITSNQKTSAEKGNILDPKNKNLSEVEKEFPVTVGNPSTPDLVKPKHGSRKRLSRPLACVDADPATDIDMGGERPHESKSKYTTLDLLEQPTQSPNEEGGAGASAGNTTESLQWELNTLEREATVMNQATIEWPDFSSASPFGDSWPDPCLEFAFKTLTGDLPVLDDTIAIQEYFQQQIFLVEGSTSPDVLAPVSNNKADTAAAAAADAKVEK